MTTIEARRLDEDARRLKNWKRWGPYLSERQWATVREDYSPDGRLWESFPYEHSLARAYRWGEDGLLGITDRECRLCFALASECGQVVRGEVWTVALPQRGTARQDGFSIASLN